MNDSIVNLELGISGVTTLALTNVDVTLTAVQAQHFVQILTGTLTANVNVIVPAESRVYVADNRTTGAFTVTVKTASGGGVAVDQGARTLVYCDGTTVYPVASGTGGGGGSGAPTDATYLVQSPHALLTGERAVTNTPTVVWDFATPGAAGAVIPDGAVTYAKMQDVAAKRLLGRYTPSAGAGQEITLGTGLTLDDAGTLTATPGGAQPLDATLTALAGLSTGANLLPYFTGVDTAAVTPISAQARSLLFADSALNQRNVLGVTIGLDVQAYDPTLTALAGVTTGADQLPFFTGTDTASTTVLTAFMRSLLDDADAATARSTLGVTGGGGGSSDFLGLTDTPDSYSGQAGKAVLVNAGATALEFGTPAAGATTFLALTDSPDSYAGQAGKGVTVNGTATGLEFTTAVTGSYDLGLTWAGTLPVSQVLLRYPFPRAVDLPAGLTGSRGVSAVAATALTTLELRHNGAGVGSVQWAAAATTATFTMASATSFAAGDVLTIHAPASADATLADLGLALAGTRAVAAGEMGATTWLGLTDTPNAYSGQGGNLVRVSPGEAGLDFTPAPSGASDTMAGLVALATHTDVVTGTDATRAVTPLALGVALTSLAGLPPATDRVSYYDSPGTAALTPLTPFARTLLDDASMVEMQTTLQLRPGIHVQVFDPMLVALSNLASAADTMPYFTGVDAADVTPLTAAGRALVAGADAAAQRMMLGLGTLATQNADAVAITGGSITGLTSTTALVVPGCLAVDQVNQRTTVPTLLIVGALIGLSSKMDMLWDKSTQHGIVFKVGGDAGAFATLNFLNAAGVQVGSITQTGSATAFNTSSDSRLKRNIHALLGGIEAIQRLRPVSFVWHSTDEPDIGFLAHELMTVAPNAVQGLPDEVNPDGSVKPQQVDQSKLVPILVAAVKELLARVEVLEQALA